MTNHYNINLPLDTLEVDPEYSPQSHRGLSRQELFVLGWFVSNPKERTYESLARECKITTQEGYEVIIDLLQLGVLRRR